MAVPDLRLVTSVLQRNTYEITLEKLLIHGSLFFTLSAPVTGSTSVCSKSSRGNRALHLSHLLSVQPLYAFDLFCVPSLLMLVLQVCILDFETISSTVNAKPSHQAFKF